MQEARADDPAWNPRRQQERLMDATRRDLLAELYHEGLEYDAQSSNGLRPRKELKPEAAELLWMLVHIVGAHRVLEIGTGHGYSTIWLADAVEPCEGTVVTVDIDEVALAAAMVNLRRHGLENRVVCQLDDGGEVLRATPAGSIDLLFLDADRRAYEKWWPDPLRVLRRGGALVVDNIDSHPEELAPFRALVEGCAGLVASVVHVGAGELIVVKSAESPHEDDSSWQEET
jgi:predicted O-methyltransferase YrrM